MKAKPVLASKQSPAGMRQIRTISLELSELNRLIYERVRLGIISHLAINPSLTFHELKNTLKTSDGNLSVHARKLEKAGYILCKKGFEDRIPRSEFRITAQGRKEFGRYLARMEEFIRIARRQF